MPASRPRRILLAAAVLAAGLTALPAVASAVPATFTPCRTHTSFECATVTVPLDRSGRVRGTVPLHVERQRGTGGRATAFIGLAGGPGQSAASLAQSTWRGLGSPVAATDQILTFDQRGTGKSGLVNCTAAFRRAHTQAEGTARCGQQLGNRRPFYSTTDSVEDIEAVRDAVGAQKVVLVGVSYGTYVALRYARAHPDRVEGLVLDSTVPLQGVDQWNVATYAAIPGVLRQLCAAAACPFTADPVADLGAVAARLQSRPRGGIFVSSRGVRSNQRIGNAALLYNLLLDGDFNPQLRAFMPGALAAARAGDWAPLVRLTGLDYGDGGDRVRVGTAHADSQAADSDGVYLATTCVDSVLPWAPSAPTSGRVPALAAADGALNPAAFAPFGLRTVLETSLGNDCYPWPSTAAQPVADSGTPLAVPTLILSGGADLRTPSSDAARTQAIVPGATVVAVGGVGHFVLGNDPSGCALTAYARFLTHAAIDDPCAGVDAAPATLPRPPLSLGSVPTLGAAGTPGRIARVAARTMVDALASSRLKTTGSTVTIGGLRGGTITSTFLGGVERAALRRVEYLRGYRVTGTVTSSSTALRATLKIDGGRASRRGTVKIVNEKLTGRIGGHRISSVNGKRSARTARTTLDPDLRTPRLSAPGADIG